MNIYRFLLASGVVIEHISGKPYLTHTGRFAVFGFYVLSGFLMTRVLNETYEFDFSAFWSNRLLRLFPPYAAFLLTGLGLIYGTTTAADFFPGVWQARPGAYDWIGVITVFPMGLDPMSWHFRPVPSIWSVGVELLNYAALYFVVARSKFVAVIVAAAAAGYHVYLTSCGTPLDDHYFPFHAALLPFSLGSLIFFFGRATTKLSRSGAVLACAPAALNCLLAMLLGGADETPGFLALFYLNLAFQVLAVWALMRLPQSSPTSISKLLGDLSYPVFLCHWQVAYVTAMLLFRDQSLGLGLMCATWMAAAGVAYVSCRLQDMLVEPLRSRIRNNALRHLAPPAGASLQQ